MTTSSFYKCLIALSLGMLLSLIGLVQIDIFSNTLIFSIFSLVVFIAFTAMIYHIGAKSVRSSDKNKFTQVAIIAIFGKLVLTLAVLFSYQKLFKPETKMYVFPFLIIYLTFTIFETWFMMRLAKPPMD